MSKAIGVDFGSGFSFVSAYDGNFFNGLMPTDAVAGIPSVAYYNKATGFIFGSAAVRNGLSDPNSTLTDFKRNMDQEYMTVGGEVFKTEDIVRGLIQHIIKTAYSRIDDEFLSISDENAEDDDIYTVFTYPINLGKGRDQRLLEIMDSGIMIETENGTKKVNMIGTIVEPYAAGLYYLKRMNLDNANVMIYDLGSGTFDCAVVNVTLNGNDPKYSVPDGDCLNAISIGGNDFDDKLMELIKSKIIADGNDINPSAMGTFRVDVNSLKHDLTANEKAYFSSTALTRYQNYLITRSEFEAATKPLLDKTIEIVGNMLEHCKKNNIVVDDIVLVGGSSRMPMVKNTLKEKFASYGFRFKVFNPSEAISYGAAYLGELNLQRMKELDLVREGDNSAQSRAVDPILPSNFGTDCQMNGKDYVEILIKKGTKLPASSPVTTYKISNSSQTYASTSVFQYGNLDEYEHTYSPNGGFLIALDDSKKIQDGHYILKNNTSDVRWFDYRMEVDEFGIVRIYVKEDGYDKEELNLEFNFKD